MSKAWGEELRRERSKKNPKGLCFRRGMTSKDKQGRHPSGAGIVSRDKAPKPLEQTTMNL